VSDYGAVLCELVPFFEREHIRFALGGGFALQALGRSRLTFDLDLIVPDVAHEIVRQHMEQLGFETLHDQQGFSNHLRGRERIDFMYLEPRTADLVLGGATKRQMCEGVNVPVARPEHLAMMKFLAVKNQPTRDRQDLPDLVFLMRLPGIDRELIREYCAKHDMLPLYDELTR